jgi:hypothetical protein
MGIKLGTPAQQASFLPLDIEARTEIVHGAVHCGKIPLEEKIHQPMKLFRNK